MDLSFTLPPPLDVPRLLLAAVLLAFVAIRVWYERGWKPERREKRHDKREHALTVGVAMSQLVCCWTWISSDSLAFADMAVPPPLRLLGFVLGVAGVVVFWWVHATLGRNFSPRLDLRPEHTLVTDGPYRFVRHPMYSIGFVLIAGYGLLSANLVVLLVPAAFMTLLVAVRIGDEEAMMAERFGPDWQVWAARTGRLFPRLR